MLPPEVEAEFKAGNFVLKASDQLFNQVDPDHSQEWLNATGKKGLVSLVSLRPLGPMGSFLYSAMSDICADSPDLGNVSKL